MWFLKPIERKSRYKLNSSITLPCAGYHFANISLYDGGDM